MYVNSERTQAYGRVMKILADLSESKLHADEQDIVREAADAMLFCEDLRADHAAEESLSQLYALTDRMVENDRMAPEKTMELTAEVEACGPLTSVR
jgi:hypothetical protein